MAVEQLQLEYVQKCLNCGKSGILLVCIFGFRVYIYIYIGVFIGFFGCIYWVFGSDWWLHKVNVRAEICSC